MGGRSQYFGGDFDPDLDFRDKACSFSPQDIPQKGDRKADFSLVLGPSGSGKSVFCLRHFGMHFFGNSYKCVYTYMLKMSTYCWHERNRKRNLAEIVKELKKQLSDYTTSFPIEDDNFLLCIVFDEAGIDSCRTHFFSGVTSDGYNQPNMQWFLTELGHICKKVHIVFTGTNLEEVTQEVDSDVPHVKVRMTRWTVDKFNLLIKNDERKAAIVKKWPILQALITNARCAYYVDKSLHAYNTFHGTIDHYGFITSVVHGVAHSYKRINRLNNVHKEEEMLTIVMYVCKLLYDENKKYIENKKYSERGNLQRVKIQKPDFDMIADESVRKKVRAFFDVNIQLKSKEYQRFDENIPSLSISPALTILLAVFLGGHASFGFNFQHFEHTVVIGELLNFLRQLPLQGRQQAVITAEEARKYRIFVLEKAVPGTRSGYLTVPRQISTGSVFINKPRASFADGFTLVGDGIRFFQAKFGEKVVVILNLLEELHKTGLLETSPMEKKKVVDYMLNHRDKDCTELTNDRSDEADAEDQMSFYNHTFPLSQLCQKMVQMEHLTIEIKLPLDESNEKVQSSVPRKLYAVFATNCQTFHIPKLSNLSKIKKKETILKRLDMLGFDPTSHFGVSESDMLKKFESLNLQDSNKGVDISLNDVDFDGKLNNDNLIPSYIRNRLRKNVELRFDFYTCNRFATESNIENES